jgi:hypothetical protein
MTIFSLDSIVDGMQLVTRGIKTAMDTASPDDLNPEDNGKIEEFAHAYMTRSEPGFKMFVQTTFANGKIRTVESDWFHWALSLREKYKEKPTKEVMNYISCISRNKRPEDKETADVSARHFITVIE